jgi:hypothetical protein
MAMCTRHPLSDLRSAVVEVGLRSALGGGGGEAVANVKTAAVVSANPVSVCTGGLLRDKAQTAEVMRAPPSHDPSDQPEVSRTYENLPYRK